MNHKTEEQISEHLANIEEYHLRQACKHLTLYERDIQDYLAQCVAAVCDVDLEQMFNSNDRVNLAHSRWLYWFAYKYMTKEPCKRIAERTHRYGKTYTQQSIARCVAKMGMMIENEPLWQRRWNIIKKVIKTQNKMTEETLTKPVRIIVPKNLKVELKQE